MRNTLAIIQLLLFIITINLSAQEYFEGQIDYKIEYESLNENIPEQYLSMVIGDSFSAYIKEDKYLMIYNSKGDLGWSKTIIRLDEGFSYVEYEKSDTIFKSKLSNNSAELIELKKNSETKKSVLGELCHSIRLKYKSTDPNDTFPITDGTFYYNPKYRLNSAKYKDYKTGFWNKFVELSESISIRNEHIYAGLFKSTSVAVNIVEKEISEDMFILDKSKVIVQED